MPGSTPEAWKKRATPGYAYSKGNYFVGNKGGNSYRTDYLPSRGRDFGAPRNGERNG